jgi:hypothetical protein
VGGAAMSTYSKARCVICGTLLNHENGTAPVCDAICYEAYLRHKADKLEPETKQQPNQQETEE